jgi:uncharacterized protein with ParB-like and HNH nuclease domain
MNSETFTVQKLFQDRRQYRVPFFQRPYVWNREDQWERLWSDVSSKAEVRTSGDRPPAHFLGAAVLEPQQRMGLIGVEVLNIIDGQQRLTTLQYLLNALAIVLRENKQNALLSVVEGCLRNSNLDTMQDPDVEVFKVWPTFRDREKYQLAMSATTLDELRERFPASFTQSNTLKKIGISHPAALEAIWYFADQICDWIKQDGAEAKPARLEAVTTATLSDLQVVSISLGEQDDAQVIFETLNGHGAQLHATDLIRNFVFMRADRENAAARAKELFETLWSPFEGAFWNEPQRRGRLQKPRLEWFLQTTLQAVLGDEVEIGRLYADYRRFAVKSARPVTAEQQLKLLDKHASNYRQLISGSGDDPIARFGRRVADWDASTTHSLALRIAASELPSGEQTEMYDDLVSYFVRRAVCGLTSKNYNKIFIQQLKKVSEASLTPHVFRKSLASLEGDASRWPADAEFKNAWLTAAMYRGNLDASRTKAMLAEIENAMRSSRSEEPVASGLENLDVDHILPTQWFEYWPLSGGTFAQASEAGDASLATLTGVELNSRQLAITRREQTKVTFGNLTLLHYGINRGLQNREFSLKREKMFAESNLHLNRALMRLDTWDEGKIAERSQLMFEIALKIWKAPQR